MNLVVGTYATHVTAHSHAGVTYSFSRRGGSCPTCRREIRRCLRRRLSGWSEQGADSIRGSLAALRSPLRAPKKENPPKRV